MGRVAKLWLGQVGGMAGPSLRQVPQTPPNGGRLCLLPGTGRPPSLLLLLPLKLRRPAWRQLAALSPPSNPLQPTSCRAAVSRQRRYIVIVIWFLTQDGGQHWQRCRWDADAAAEQQQWQLREHPDGPVPCPL